MNEHRDPHDPEDFPIVESWIKQLPDDEPSLAWRAELNAKLEAIQPTTKTKRRWIAWPMLSSAAGVAAVAAFVILANRPGDVVEPARTLAISSDTLVDAHVESVTRYELGLATGSDLRHDHGGRPASYEWDIVDLNVL